MLTFERRVTDKVKIHIICINQSCHTQCQPEVNYLKVSILQGYKSSLLNTYTASKNYVLTVNLQQRNITDSIEIGAHWARVFYKAQDR